MADIITLDSNIYDITKHLKKHLNNLEHCWILFDAAPEHAKAIGYAYRCTSLQILDAARQYIKDHPDVDLQLLEYFLSGQELMLSEVIL